LRYSNLRPTGADDTPYRPITMRGLGGRRPHGQQSRKMAPEAIQQLTERYPE